MPSQTLTRKGVAGGLSNSQTHVRRAAIEALEDRKLLAAYNPFPFYTSVSMTGYFAQAGTVDLQNPVALSPDGDEARALPRNVPVNANGLPLLNSRPNMEGLEVFLDFSRNTGGQDPYSLDGDLNNFNFDEQRAIYNAWRGITGFFSQFNVNVTTVEPPRGPNDPVFAWHKPSNSISGGYAFLNSLNKDRPTGFNQSGDVLNRLSGIAHEFGHMLGLPHQSNFDQFGEETQNYSNGDGYRNVPTMGVDFNGAPNSRWWLGRSNFGSEAAIVSDRKILTDKIRSVVGGNGLRPDDFGNTLTSAKVLSASSGALDGYISPYDDVDVFKVTATSQSNWNFTSTPLYGSNFQPKLELLDFAGNVIAARDDADYRNGRTNEQWLNVLLEPGTYYARVSSSGDYAEHGYYQFSATELPGFMISEDVGGPRLGGNVTYDPATGIFTQGTGGTDIWAQNDQLHFTYATLRGNGSITARVDALDNLGTFTKAGVMIRQSGAANSANAYMGLLPSGAIDSIIRYAPGQNSQNVNNNGQGPWVRLGRSGESVTFAVSSNGVNWTNLATRNIPWGQADLQIGLATSAWNDRQQAFATFSNVSIVGNTAPAAPDYNNLAAPTGFSVMPGPGDRNTSIGLSWNSVSGATGYRIEHSINGVDFTTVTTLGAASTSVIDTSPWGSMRWFYRVSAADGSGRFSPPSTVKSTVNRPNAPGLPDYTAPVIKFNPTTLGLNFLDVQGETGYRIDGSIDNGASYQTLRTTFANETSTNLNDLRPGMRYRLLVTPLSAAGDGAQRVINTTTPIDVVQNVGFSSRTSNAMTLTWTAQTAANGFHIDRSTNGQSWSNVATVGQTNSWTDTNVTPGVEYYYRVFAFDSDTTTEASQAAFASPPAASLPGNWTNTDIGDVFGGPGAGGSAVSTGANAFRVVSAGYDVYNNQDQFNFTYQPLAGDGSLTVRVASLENNHPAAKAGVILREGTAPGARSVAIMINAGNGYGVDLRVRSNTNGGTSFQRLQADVAAPYWLRLSRTGNAVKVEFSANGTNWTVGNTINNFNLSNALIGFGSNSYDDDQLNTSTFDNVSLVGANDAPVLTGGSYLFDADEPYVRIQGSERLFAGANLGNLTLRNLTTGGNHDGAITAIAGPAGDQNAIEVRYFAGGQLPNGNYRLTVPAGAVVDSQGAANTSAFSYEFFILAGDANRDRTVDLADFVILRNNFNQTNRLFSQADFNYDGTVDLQDFVILRNNFGQSVPGNDPDDGSLFG